MCDKRKDGGVTRRSQKEVGRMKQGKKKNNERVETDHAPAGRGRVDNVTQKTVGER